jgi:hypothetical protein
MLLPNDLIVIRNKGVDYGGYMGHQEGAGEVRRHTHGGGDPIKFRIMKSDFESNMESRITLHLN